MKLVPFRSRAEQQQPELIRNLESVLADARAGKLHRIVIVAVDDQTGETTTLRHRTESATLIGGLSCLLHKLQHMWNGL